MPTYHGWDVFKGPLALAAYGPQPGHSVRTTATARPNGKPEGEARGFFGSMLYDFGVSMAPQGKYERRQGAGRVVHIEGFATALVFWDNTKADNRPGSITGVLMKGVWTFAQALEQAQEAFPMLFEGTEVYDVGLKEDCEPWQPMILALPGQLNYRAN